jgi:hypothetical protein
MFDVSHAYGFNVFRIWNTVSRWPDNGIHPWARLTPGAADGGNKYDLDTWKPGLLCALKDLVAHASDSRDRGRSDPAERVLLRVGLQSLNAANNIQGVGTGGWKTFPTLGMRRCRPGGRP